jgi:sulfur-carrier protein adenylyltransferase/sulfurtransferase
MDKKYIYLTILLIALGIILVALPPRGVNKEISPEQLLQEINGRTRFISADELTRSLVEKDPSIQLVDVRLPEEFAHFALPGAINIPLADLLNPQWTEILNQNIKKNIFYSNGTIYANQAWVICRRLSYKNNYVLDGGLNQWFSLIMETPKPDITASKSEKERYDFRLSARSFFGGQNTAVSTNQQQNVQPASTNKTPTAPKKKAGGGGC